ncbi:hypothetical protein A2376_02560 [Candidatus Woesebacteria bacterium RIFOXYB1_FULL_47_31]|nr:MAG: hypothetical protein A2376_02560 [Candidatus Woesebacteria bacterium RIFOXYB1_FULL_47_31]
MSHFKERLSQLRTSLQERVVQEKLTVDLARQQQEGAEKTRKIQEQERMRNLRVAAQNSLGLILEDVNMAFLGGRGQIELETPSPDNASIKLKWDYKLKGNRRDEYYKEEWNEISFSIDFDGKINGSGLKESTNLGEEDWKDKVESGILKILESGGWYRQVYTPGSPGHASQDGWSGSG